MAKNLTLGRGELWFGQYKAGTEIAGGERYLGNSPEFNATIESENLDHFDSDHGINEKDDSIPLSTNRSGSFITDNISPENVALFFFGSKTVFAVAAGSVTSEQHNGVGKGLTYQLGMSLTNPTGNRNVSTVVVKSDGGTPTTYTVGTDYTVDLALGRVSITENSSIPNDSNLRIDYSVAASSRTRIISGSTPIIGALRYIAFNPAGQQLDWYMPYVKISPNGDYALKGDEWQQIPFNIEILKKTGFEALYIDGRPYTP